jgi:serine-type D-Ala-D-Ala endopeptidase (penicillin-binding protein 7)
MITQLIVTAMLIAASVEALAAKIEAKSWLIADGNGQILESENINIQQPIASITKLMTVMVVLDSNQSLIESVGMRKFRGIAVTRQQLIDLAIVHSDNEAATMLCKIYRRGYDKCIEDMNHKAQVLGMTLTEFHDSTGLDNRNVSTPEDLIKLLLAAEKYPEIVHASNQGVVELIKKKRKWRFNNTNPLVNKYNILVSKTGYVRLSGGCLVMSAIIEGKKRLFVVLNSRTTRTRIHDMEQLVLSTISAQ